MRAGILRNAMALKSSAAVGAEVPSHTRSGTKGTEITLTTARRRVVAKASHQYEELRSACPTVKSRFAGCLAGCSSVGRGSPSGAKPILSGDRFRPSDAGITRAQMAKPPTTLAVRQPKRWTRKDKNGARM